MHGKSQRPLIFDANVLIDYCESDRTVLKLISNHISQICVATPILDEVVQLSTSDCALLDIVLVEPDIELYIQAGVRRGGLSTNDHLCLLLAQSQGLACVTNDRPLRKECTMEGVPVLWGLEPLFKLVHESHLPAKEAAAVVSAMQAANPLYINADVVGRFMRKIGYRP